MRHLHIASSAPASKATLLELEIQLEKARTRRLTAEQEAALLLRLQQGDATAIPLLVDSWQVYIFSIVQQYLNATIRIAPLVATAQQALTRLAERELNATGTERFFRFGTFAIRQAIVQALRPTPLPEPEGNTHEVLAQQVPLLNTLNNLLLQQEIQLAAAVGERLRLLYQQVKHSTHYSSEVETELVVEWYLKDERNPVHECWLSFHYRDADAENKLYPLLSGNTTTYRKSHLPPLDQPYCFLLYHLLEKARPRIYSLLSSIDRIQIQVEEGIEWMTIIE